MYTCSLKNTNHMHPPRETAEQLQRELHSSQCTSNQMTSMHNTKGILKRRTVIVPLFHLLHIAHWKCASVLIVASQNCIWLQGCSRSLAAGLLHHHKCGECNWVHAKKANKSTLGWQAFMNGVSVFCIQPNTITLYVHITYCKYFASGMHSFTCVSALESSKRSINIHVNCIVFKW